jgi:hypothetical protein
MNPSNVTKLQYLATTTEEILGDGKKGKKGKNTNNGVQIGGIMMNPNSMYNTG